MPKQFASTAEWAKAQLLKMDWVLRHHHLEAMAANKPALFDQVRCLLTPLESKYGRNSPRLLEGVVILKDDPNRPRGGRQTTLETYNFKVKKKGLKQTTLFEYSFRVVSHE